MNYDGVKSGCLFIKVVFAFLSQRDYKASTFAFCIEASIRILMPFLVAFLNAAIINNHYIHFFVNTGEKNNEIIFDIQKISSVIYKL